MGNTLTDDVRVQSFIYSMGQADHFKPVSLVIDVISMNDGGCMEHREKIVVRFSYTVRCSRGFFAYLVVKGVVTGNT